MNFIDPDIQTYAERHTTPESELLSELVEAATEELEYIDMLSGPVVGRLLTILIHISGAKRVLEIGTFAGYSALTMAAALPVDGEIITCEVNERYARLARTFFERSEHGAKIKLMMGEALDSLSNLEGAFDIVFIDADKVNYPAYYEAVLPKLKQGGIIIADNVLWSGKILDPSEEKARIIDQFNKIVANDDRVEQVVLTERDGITIVRKI